MKFQTISIFVMLCLLSLSIRSYGDVYTDYNTNLVGLDFNDYINIRDLNDLEIKRQELINWVWKDGRTNLTPTITSDVSKSVMPYYSTISSTYIQEIDKIEYSWESFSSDLYFIKNTNSNNRLFIYSPGHAQSPGDVGMINAMLENNYDVLIKYMVCDADNTCPVSGATLPIKHNNLGLLYSSIYNPVEDFLNDLYWSISYLDDIYNFEDISMTGISGGGWTSAIYPALDSRLKNSYPISGSYPRVIADVILPSGGDWEQGLVGTTTHDFFTQNVTYMDMYLVGSVNGGKQRQIFIQYDTCCWWGINYRLYGYIVKGRAFYLGGDYDTYIDEVTNDHAISTATKNYIISENEDVAEENITEYPTYIKVGINALESTNTNKFYNKGLYSSLNGSSINWFNIIWGDWA